MKLINLSSDYSGLHICGPQAQPLMAKLAERDMDTLNFPFMSAAIVSISEVPQVITLRVSYTGETGYEMYLPSKHQVKLFELLLKEGRAHGV